MTIEWNKVTWYSKIAAVVLFVATFILGFWLGSMKTEVVYVEVPRVVNHPAEQNGISTSTMNFVGHVTRNEVFQKDLGNGLIFKLTPSDTGWNIDITSGDAQHGGYGFASVATPPFRSINSLQVEGWHFRNKDNTAPNDGSVNAPQEKRDFSFVLNKKDAGIMASAVQEFTSGKTLDFISPVQTGNGEVTIHNLKLGNLKSDSLAWIDAIDISVTLRFPSSN